MGDQYWKDRDLTPVAMSGSLLDCSEAKIEEIGQENAALKVVFDRLRTVTEAQRRIPFTPEEVGLDMSHAAILEENGVVLRDEERWYMPEIYRHGLGFGLEARARPRILTLYRRARRGERR